MDNAVYTANGLTAASAIVFALGLASFLLPLLFLWLLRRPDRGLRGRFHVLMLSTLIAVLLFELSKSSAPGPTALVRMLQSFTTDADYGFMAERVLSGSEKLSAWVARYRALLYSIAPLLGAALIYEVFAGLSPKLRLAAVFRLKRLYVFSELNPRSLALAEDLVRRKPAARLAVVFTDCYISGADEDASELLMRARAIGAICIREDIRHSTPVQHGRSCRFFLLDTTEDGALDDESNLLTARRLMEPRKTGLGALLCRREIYFFSDDSAAIESLCVLDIDQRYRDRRPVPVHVVRDRALACCEQLSKTPLFLALPKGADGRAAKGTPLRVAILGDGPFAKEMFRNVFWCGQMLDHPLQISVIGQGAPEAFYVWLNGLSPEILQSCQSGHEILQARLDGGWMPPYASVDYGCADLSRGALRELLEKPRLFPGAETPYQLRDCDYFFVMTGAELDNLRLAEELSRCLCLYNRERGVKAHQIVAAAVESEELQKLTRELNEAEERKAGRSDMPGLVCFGSLSERFCWENVARESKLFPETDGTQKSAPAHSLDGLRSTQGGEIYDSWSAYGRRLHLPYKMFSLCGETECDAAAKVRYWDALDRDLRQGGAQALRLTWLEHRRWCAFLRCHGFTQPPLLRQFLRQAQAGTFEKTDRSWIGYKDIPARTHPNLVECGVGADPEDLLELAGTLRKKVSRPPDPNREARAKRRQDSAETRRTPPTHPHAGQIPGSLKAYDIPYGSYAPRLDRAEISGLLGRTPDWGELENSRVREKGDEYYLDLIDGTIGEELRRKAGCESHQEL